MKLSLLLAVIVSLVAAAGAQAAPGSLRVLVAGNGPSVVDSLKAVIATQPGVGVVDAAPTNTDTPSAATLAGYDVVVSLGDSNYADAATWGDRLADYVDAGGAVLQAAYDNWETGAASPTGRWLSGGYAPLLNGPNDNLSVTLGTLVVPAHPLLQGLGTFPNSDNTTTALAPGATLLAKWSDDRNAIAVKGRVAATSASADEEMALPDLARLAVNTGNYLGRHNVTVTKSGTGRGTVTFAPAGDVSCGLVCTQCGLACSQLLPFGATASLTAAAQADSKFAGWTGACTGTGACRPTIAGAEVSVGAVFNLATFSRRTNVTISALSRKATSSGRFKLRVRNGNSFSVKAAVGARGVKTKKTTLKAKKSKTISLTLGKSLRAKLAQNGKIKLSITAKLKSPAGRTRTVKKKVTLRS